MIAQFFRKHSLLAIALVCFVNINADHKTDEIQVLVDPSASWFYFLGFNATNGFGTNVFAPRVAGGYYYLNGLIYPKDTIDRDATCFATDEPSIGTFTCIAHLLADLSFDENFPVDTVVEEVRWSFYFDEECDGEANNIIAFGRVFSGEFIPNAIGFEGEGMPVIGTECNDRKNFIKSARAYFNNFGVCNNGPQILIEIKFEEKIEYNA